MNTRKSAFGVLRRLVLNHIPAQSDPEPEYLEIDGDGGEGRLETEEGLPLEVEE